MMKKTFALILLAAFAISTAVALSPKWLDIILRQKEESAFIVRSIPSDSVATIQHIPGTKALFDSLEVTIVDSGKRYTYPLDSIARCELRRHIPVINIVTDSAVYDVTSKEKYLDGIFSMTEGAGVDTDYEAVKPVKVKVRGRGNSTWMLPKKPYRLKFDKKISICGLKKAKNYVLIANYIDPTLLHNAAAFEIASRLGMPWTNHSIPVDVYFNGRYCGAYMLSEKVGINAGSVDIDEDTGLLLEMDEAMDENYCYKSPLLQLPIMIKDPDIDEIAEKDTTLTAAAIFDSIKAEFNTAEASLLVADKDAWRNYFDLESAVNYVLIQNVTGNWDFTHPKSLYVWREKKGDKFKFGPVWDFDWTADYYVNHGFELDYGYPLLTSNDSSADMFRYMTRTEAFWDFYRAQWEKYKNHIWPEVKAYLLAYTDLIETSAYTNGELWHPNRADRHRYYWKPTTMLRKSVEDYITWLERRMEYIDQSPSMGLYW